MTEIRNAGQYVSSMESSSRRPLWIKAIADPDDLERSLTLMGGVIESLEENLGLKVSIKKSEEIIIGKFIDDGTSIKTDLLTTVE
jgi:uncharacterized protein YlxW (UPF0749 family)